MSWSVNRKGNPTEVKEQLVHDFNFSKKGTAVHPVEQKSVEQAEVIVNSLLDSMIESGHPQVQVTGNGSATSGYGDAKANCSFNLSVNPY